MSNMSYCRWQNTLEDLRDCAGHIHDTLTGEEARARAFLLQLAADMLEEIGVTIDYRELENALSHAPVK